MSAQRLFVDSNRLNTVWQHLAVHNLRAFSCEEFLSCIVPDISAFRPQWTFVERVHEVPIALVRTDGVIFSTGMTFTYTPEVAAQSRRPVRFVQPANSLSECRPSPPSSS
jgi:hypothetical protein